MSEEIFNPEVVFYHFPCPDGFGAYVIARASLLGKNILFIPYDHADDVPIEQIQNKNVLMIDCCFDPNKLLILKTEARTVTILDHHAGNKQLIEKAGISNDEKLHLHFDLNKSGIHLAWIYFNPSSDPPPIVKYIEDRDLGKYQYKDDTIDFCSYVDSLGYVFEEWRQLLEIQNNEKYQNILATGRMIRNYHKKLTDDFVKYAFVHQLPEQYGGYSVGFVNAPKPFNTGAATQLLKENSNLDFVISFAYEKIAGIDYVRLSIRSKTFNVMPFAQMLGGNGHPNASGALVTVGVFLELLNQPHDLVKTVQNATKLGALTGDKLQNYVELKKWNHTGKIRLLNIYRFNEYELQIPYGDIKYADYDKVMIMNIKEIALAETRSEHLVLQEILKS